MMYHICYTEKVVEKNYNFFLIQNDITTKPKPKIIIMSKIKNSCIAGLKTVPTF